MADKTTATHSKETSASNEEVLNQAMIAAVMAATQKVAVNALNEEMPQILVKATEAATIAAIEAANNAAVKVSKVNGIKKISATVGINVLTCVATMGAVYGISKYMNRNKMATLQLPASMTE